MISPNFLGKNASFQPLLHFLKSKFVGSLTEGRVGLKGGLAGAGKFHRYQTKRFQRTVGYTFERRRLPSSSTSTLAKSTCQKYRLLLTIKNMKCRTIMLGDLDHSWLDVPAIMEMHEKKLHECKLGASFKSRKLRLGKFGRSPWARSRNLSPSDFNLSRLANNLQ